MLARKTTEWKTTEWIVPWINNYPRRMLGGMSAAQSMAAWKQRDYEFCRG